MTTPPMSSDTRGEALEERALAIVKAHYPEMPANYRGRRYQIALAAIIETTEAAALFCRGWLSSAPSAAKPIRDFEHLKRHLSMTEPAHSRPDGSAFSQEEHDRYVIRDDVPPTVHARMNSATGRWESPVDVRLATPTSNIKDNPDD